jgi:hypothetical protein
VRVHFRIAKKHTKQLVKGGPQSFEYGKGWTVSCEMRRDDGHQLARASPTAARAESNAAPGGSRELLV